MYYVVGTGLISTVRDEGSTICPLYLDACFPPNFNISEIRIYLNLSAISFFPEQILLNNEPLDLWKGLAYTLKDVSRKAIEEKIT